MEYAVMPSFTSFTDIIEVTALSRYSTLYQALQQQTPVWLVQVEQQRPLIPGEVLQYQPQLPQPLQQWSDHQYEYRSYPAAAISERFSEVIMTLAQTSLGNQLQWMLQLTLLLEHFHNQQLMLGDLRAEAIFRLANSKTLVLVDAAQAIRVSSIGNLSLSQQLDLPMLRTLAPEASGRVNAPLDQRSDLYSLGVLFYAILSGHYPFEQQQAIELVHAHIALPPAPLVRVPKALANLVLTLLQKNPNQRYSQIRGLRHDIEILLQQWTQQQQLDLPQLALRLGASQLQFSSRLYGRERQLVQLVDCCQQARSQQNNQLVLLEGYSGVGKSALLEQLYRQTLTDRPYFCRGKFDQYQRNQLYSALQQALTELAEQLLQSPAAELQQLQQQLQQKLGMQLPVLLTLIPALQPLCSDIPPPMMLNPAHEHNFDLLLLKFFREISSYCQLRQRPLLLWLDDLQWADLSSLRLLQAVLTDAQIHGLVVLLSFRNQDIAEVHPLRHMLEQLRQAHVSSWQIELGPLELDAVTALLADTLQQAEHKVQPLASLLIEKTSGNPFFVRQFLLTLQQQQLLSCDLDGQWQFDLAAIAGQHVTDNLADMTAGQLNRLDPAVLMLLKAAALLGETAEVQVLMAVLQQEYAKLLPLLSQAVEAGIVLAFRHPRDGRIDKLRFAHDRLQQAAFDLIADDAPQLHKAIADYYLQFWTADSRQQQIFAFIDHLNAAGAEAVDQYSAAQIARLNLQAGLQAQASNAWHEAAAYFQQAWQLTQQQPQTAVAFEALFGLANCQYLTQQYETAGINCQQLVLLAANLLQRMQVARLEILLLFARNDFAPAFTLADTVLQPIGIDIMQLDDIASRYPQLEQLYDHDHIADLAQIPALAAPEQLMAMEILNVLLTVAYLVSPLHYLSVSFALVQLSIRQGHCAASSKAYSTHAMILSGAFGQYKAALDFADLALQINTEYQGKFAAELTFQRAATVLPWNAPLRQCLQALEQNIYQALSQGNLEFAAHSALFFSFYQSLSGTPLDQVASDFAKYRQFIADKRFAYNLEFIRLWQQYVLNLQNPEGDPQLLCGEAFDETVQLPLLQESQNLTILFCYHGIKLQLALIYQDDVAALHHYQAALPLTAVAMSLYHQTEFYFSAGLLATRQCQQLRGQAEQAGWLTLANNYLQQLQLWSVRGEANHLHKTRLLQAQLAALADDPLAWQLYDESIRLAQHQGFVQHAALAAECCASYWQQLQKVDFATLYLQQALKSYQQWQAQHKVQQLQQLLGQQQRVQNQLLDMVSVLKAAEMLSGQIDLTAFLQQMIDLIVENAGAQAGRLLLLDEQQQLQHKASSPQDCADRPLSAQLIALVSRTLQPRLINDPFSASALLQDIPAPAPASLLCLPVIIGGQLCGLLYLEHFELSGAFTEERLNLLQLLANQTAILSANTRLYHQVVAANKNLEQKVWERTQELASAKIKAESATAAKSSFLARMSHEIRTPINAVIGLSRLAGKTALSAEQSDYLSKIQESGEVLLSLVNDILDFSKIEAGKLALEITRFNLDKVLQRAVNLNALKAHSKSLELVCDIDPALPAVLLGDPLRLQQILVNLISNAVKFSDKGIIGIGLKIIQLEGEQLTVQLSVSDNGIGITPEQQQGLFQSFSQADDSITRKYGGSGLGLAICKQLCELMQGRIWLESQAGKGSTFYCQLQLQAAEAVPASQVLPMDIHRLNALVVDDISLARTVLLSLLGEIGISAEETDNGYQAVEMVRQAKISGKPYDFVLMDWRMPGIDGIETSRRIQQLDDAPHILMVSAYDREQAKASLNEVKISQFIEKPVNQSHLLDAIYGMLQQEQPTRGKHPELQVPDLSGYRILLVEDHAINRQVALGLLKDSAVKVDIAENGLQALQRIQQQHYDLVLMDIQMPEMDGLTACQHIRQQLLLTELPVIAMTAHALASDIEQSKAAGMNAHLTKPIEPAQLFQTLLQFLPAENRKVTMEQAASQNPTLAEQQQLALLTATGCLDCDQALKNLGGKLTLYLNLVRDFVKEQQLQPQQLQNLLQQQQWPQLHLDVHSLKATSAYIGAFDLSQLCQQFEHSLLVGEPEPQLLHQLVPQLRELLQQIMTVLPEQPKPSDQHRTLPQLLDALLPLLQESDFAAEELLPSLFELGKNSADWSTLCQIADNIRQVEYEKAASQTLQLIRQLQLTPVPNESVEG